MRLICFMLHWICRKLNYRTFYQLWKWNDVKYVVWIQSGTLLAEISGPWPFWSLFKRRFASILSRTLIRLRWNILLPTGGEVVQLIQILRGFCLLQTYGQWNFHKHGTHEKGRKKRVKSAKLRLKTMVHLQLGICILRLTLKSFAKIPTTSRRSKCLPESIHSIRSNWHTWGSALQVLQAPMDNFRSRMGTRTQKLVRTC